MGQTNKTQKTKQGPTEEDVYIGIRLRTKRSILGWSQERLAKALDLSFQQVQKYENGTNRISSGTLYKISKILDVPFDYFVSGMEEYLFKTLVGFSDTDQEPIDGAPFARLEDYMSDKEIVRFINKYRKIAHNPKHVKLVNEMMNTLAKSSLEGK